MAFVPVVYSSGVPVLASSGTQRVACAHLAEWLKVYDALQVARDRGHVTYYQTMGGADASAGTHLCGSAWDMAYTGTAPIMDAREMGAAVWPRLHSLGWPASLGEHVHGLISCGDNACNAYQYTAYWNGCNGLGLNGVGGTDPLPKPSQRRTWQQGIAWANAQIRALTATQGDDSMMHLGGPGLPSFIVNSSGAVVQMDADHQPVGLKLVAGTTDALNPTEMQLAQDIVNGLAQNRGFDGKPRPMAPVVAPAATVDVAAIAQAVWAPIRKA